MSQEDMEQLDRFVSNVQEDIGLLISNIGVILPESEELQRLIGDAWNDVKPRFEQISLYLVGKKELEGLDEQLQERGLTGVQLRLKLSVYQSRRNDFQAEWKKFEDAGSEEKKERRGFIGGIIRRLLSIIDRILGSLGFIPGTEAIAEVKGVLEELV